MNTEILYDRLKLELESMILFLEDKPEETVESTIKACWFAAAGIAKSAEASVNLELPELTEQQIIILNGLLNLRLQNIPLAHITGRQSFMGIELLSDRRALIPRKETEILGKKALQISYELGNEKPIRVMDICCGAGNIGLSIAYLNKEVDVFSTDLSPEAIELTRDNITLLNLGDRVKAIPGDLFSAFENENHFGNTNLIVCNPPYISSAKVSRMNKEISNHEPSLAFDGGMFGTKIIQRLILEAPKFLSNDGWLIFEVGVGQGEFILRFFEDSLHYEEISTLSDDLGNIRVILARKKINTF